MKLILNEDMFPLCAKCKKVVERMEVYEDMENGDKVITVFCHGENEVLRLSPAMLMNITFIKGGIAFNESHLKENLNTIINK